MATFTTTTIAIFMMCLSLSMAKAVNSPSDMDVSDRCTTKALLCGNVLRDFMRQRDDILNNTDIASLCAQTGSILKCYGDCAPEIRPIPMMGLGIRIREYICDPSKRDEVKTVFLSQCHLDDTLSQNQQYNGRVSRLLSFPPYANMVIRQQIETAFRSQCLRDLSQPRHNNMNACIALSRSMPNDATVIRQVRNGDYSNAHLICPTVDAMGACIGRQIAGLCEPEVLPVAEHIGQMIFNDLVRNNMPPCASPII